MLEVFAEGGPRHIVLDVALVLDHLAPHFVRERPHRFSFSENLQRYTLPDVALASSVLDERLGGPAQHVDEAWRDSHPAGVDVGLAPRTRQIADRSDLVANQPNVCNARLIAASIIDGTAADQDVEREAR